jgi:hypothetical protein
MEVVLAGAILQQLRSEVVIRRLSETHILQRRHLEAAIRPAVPLGEVVLLRHSAELTQRQRHSGAVIHPAVPLGKVVLPRHSAAGILRAVPSGAVTLRQAVAVDVRAADRLAGGIPRLVAAAMQAVVGTITARFRY